MRELFFDVTESENSLTAESFLKRHGVSKRLIIKLKHTGGLTRNGVILRSVDPVYAGERVKIKLGDSADVEPNPDIKAGVAYEDEDIVVFEKPPFLPVHSSLLHHNDTLANLFAALYPDTPFRCVNRLDRNTSGLCVCAKNAFAAAALGKSVHKTYYAVIDGDIDAPGSIDAPIGRTDGTIIKREVRPVSRGGQEARTYYKPLLRKNGRTLLEVTLATGRTHQIRVHFAYIGYPLCGDELYGGDCSAIQRQALHCGKAEFVQPVTKQRISLASEIPQDINNLLDV